MPDPVRVTIEVLESLLAGYERDFEVRLWDGTVLEPASDRTPRFTFVLKHPGSLRALLWPPSQLTMAEAYLYDDIDLEGSLDGVFRLADHLLVERRWSAAERLKLARRLLRLPSERAPRVGRGPARLRGARSSLLRSRKAVGYHYDLPPEFYALYLDRRMVYTCGYFGSEEDSLDTAQERKLDHICRKLRLQPGERLLDIGCGFGGLILHAAKRYGVDALGVTLSPPQADYANARIAEAGLADRVRVEVRDYRELDEPEVFDKVASICMFEQVPEDELPDFFARAGALLRPGGVFLNQGIAAHADFERTARRGPSFIERYVFPDGGVVSISAALRAAESAGLEVRDVEGLREHYVLTLRHWVSRLEQNAQEARALADDVTYRVWRLYMAGSAYQMEQGRLNVYQALLAKPDRGAVRLPLTRDDLYEAADAREPAQAIAAAR